MLSYSYLSSTYVNYSAHHLLTESACMNSYFNVLNDLSVRFSQHYYDENAHFSTSLSFSSLSQQNDKQSLSAWQHNQTNQLKDDNDFSSSDNDNDFRHNCDDDSWQSCEDSRNNHVHDSHLRWLCCDHDDHRYHKIHLKFNNIMFFNSENTKITLFISCFQDIALLKRDCSVLCILSQCLKKNVLKWYFSLLYEIRMHMSNSLKKWEFQLFEQYDMTCVVVLDEMNKFKYCFFSCDALSIHIFLIKK